MRDIEPLLTPIRPLIPWENGGGLLECRYHGLQFDGAGTCVFNPHGDQIPPRAHVRSYPIVEKHRALWVWMGDPANADPGMIFPLPFLDDDRYAAATGYLHIKADRPDWLGMSAIVHLPMRLLPWWVK